MHDEAKPLPIMKPSEEEWVPDLDMMGRAAVIHI
jgi:hypothetical protein